MKLRLDKYLADMGLGSRADVKKLVRAGEIYVNGWRVRTPDTKVDPQADVVERNHERIEYAAFEYWMLNKPAGVVSATRDDGSETVVDLLHGAHRKDLFPVGRLDKDTVGLLLITNDGQLAHKLLTPGKHVSKVYFARLEHSATKEDIQAFAQGIDIGDDTPTLPAQLEILDPARANEVYVTLHEGRYHQVKRMFEARGNKVEYLKRTAMGTLVLDPALEEGESRPLTAQELECLL
jgi:16S rRNA pseudouridine516 synthase